MDRPDFNTRVVLNRRPRGVPDLCDFRVETRPVPEPAAGQVLLRTLFLSLDPYVRGRIGASVSGSSSTQVGLGEVIEGTTVAEVIASRDASFRPGDIVLSAVGWQRYGVQSAADLRHLDPGDAPLSVFLGVLGMPGFTAYVGTSVIARPAAGETLVVAAAAGPVGCMAGQLASAAGARVVGIAGGAEKTEWLRQIGFHAVVDHRSATFAADLEAATPDGVDVYFESVGGRVSEQVFGRLNRHARIPLCGQAAHYNGESPQWMINPATVLAKALHVVGFRYLDYVDRYADRFQAVARPMFAEGLIRYREDVEIGIENAPRAFIRLVTGQTFGKALIRA